MPCASFDQARSWSRDEAALPQQWPLGGRPARHIRLRPAPKACLHALHLLVPGHPRDVWIRAIPVISIRAPECIWQTNVPPPTARRDEHPSNVSAGHCWRHYQSAFWGQPRQRQVSQTSDRIVRTASPNQPPLQEQTSILIAFTGRPKRQSKVLRLPSRITKLRPLRGQVPDSLRRPPRPAKLVPKSISLLQRGL